MPRRLFARRALGHAIHARLQCRPGGPRAGGAWRGQLHCRRGNHCAAGRRGACTVPVFLAGRHDRSELEPQRRHQRDRRYSERAGQCTRHDAASGKSRRSRNRPDRRARVICRASRGTGARGVIVIPNDVRITPELVAEHGLKPDEYDRILKLIGREPSLTELGIFSAMWNEHCSYKSSKIHLRTLPTKGPWVIQGPGENAGVIDIGDGLACVFKMESHNHPSYIEPYQGAATGVGGILRDVFTMGARPIAALNFLRFGEPRHPKTRHLVSGVVAGIGGYGNSFGVPTVGGSVRFHQRYDGNCLVNAMAVGIVRKDQIFYAAASGVGMPIVYLGSKTGRDGIHGATMASAEFDEDSESKRPTVQVGDPFTEKLLLEACLELFQTDALVGIQDMGAAGLTSSSIEMAGRAGSGIEIDVAKVPRREEGMSPYECMLSESQERMLIVAKKGREQEILD